MKIDEIKFILENKIRQLQETKNAAIKLGDLERSFSFDAEIIETQKTLESLNGQTA